MPYHAQSCFAVSAFTPDPMLKPWDPRDHCLRLVELAGNSRFHCDIGISGLAELGADFV